MQTDWTTTTNNRGMNYGAGNVTQCEAEAPDGLSTRCTAGCVPDCSSTWHRGRGAPRQLRPEWTSQNSSVSALLLLGYPSMQTALSTQTTHSPAGEHSITTGWPLYQTELGQSQPGLTGEFMHGLKLLTETNEHQTAIGMSFRKYNSGVSLRENILLHAPQDL